MTLRLPIPPFDVAAATLKVRLAENAWNTRDPETVAQAYTVDGRWRNRAEFIHGREAIEALLRRKWLLEREYRLIKELWGFRENRMAVRFAYEWCDADGAWSRAYGTELWQFDQDGLMEQRHASINDLPIDEGDRLFRWTQGPRPADHPGLSELGL